MKPEEILKIVIEEIENQLVVSEDAKGNIKPESDLKDDLDFDSLDEIEMIINIEKRFDIDITDEQAISCDTVQDVVNLIAKLLPQSDN